MWLSSRLLVEDENTMRYRRQLPTIGERGQRRLRGSTVAVVGVGGLGCVAATYLTAAGIGRIFIIDRDVVEESNLNRQFLYGTSDIGKPKADVAAERLRELNPDVDVIASQVDVNGNNIMDLIAEVDLVVDGLDNWKSRFALNDACVRMGVPYVHAGVSGFRGQLTVIAPGRGPCLRCIFKEVEEERSSPILGPVAGAIGSLEAMEAIKLITETGEPLIGRLLLFDGRSLDFEIIRVERDPECPICSSI